MSLDTLRLTAQTLIAQFGKRMTLEHTVKGAYAPETGVTGADTVSLYPVHGSPPTSASFVQQPGSLIQAGDLMTYLAAAELDTLGVDLAAATEETWTLILDAVPWRIVEKRPHYIQETIGLWEVVLRT